MYASVVFAVLFVHCREYVLHFTAL